MRGNDPETDSRPRTLFDRLRAPAFAVFCLQFGLIELCARGVSSYRATPRAVLLVLASALFWALLAMLARSAIARVIVALAAAWLVVVQLIFFRYYHAFLGDDATACARYMWADVEPVVANVFPWAALTALAASVPEYLLLWSAPRRNRRTIALLVAALFASLALSPAPRDTPADLAALWSLRLLLEPHEARAASEVDLPKLDTRRERLPNVLFVLTESVRANDYAAPELRAAARRSLALVPNRVELSEMRSVGSYTAIAVNALFSGRIPLGSHEQIASTPLLFDYLRATRGAATRPYVVYWSAQGGSFFERHDFRTATDSVAFVDDLVGRRVETLLEVVELGVDRMLADRVVRELRGLPRPLFLLVHMSGTHAPYFVDDSHAPFRPYRHSVTWSGLEDLHRAYLDAIVAQDESVARIMSTFLSAVGSEPYVIFFTSDHGEAFGEHRAIHHGQNLYDEQIHVPAWIAWGNGALDDSEAAALRAHVRDFVTHLDLLPTLLDAYGVLDAFGMIPERKDLVGRSLLRSFAAPLAPMPATNCTQLFPCPLKNYGMLGEGRAIVAQPWDYDFRCVDLVTGHESGIGSDPTCMQLREASRRYYDVLPNGRANR